MNITIVAVLFEYLMGIAAQLQLPAWLSDFTVSLLLLAALGLAAYLLFIVVRAIVIFVFSRIAQRTTSPWDDIVLKHRVLHDLAHLVPAFILNAGVAFLLPATESYAWLIQAVKVLAAIYAVWAVAHALCSFVNAAHEIYLRTEISKTRPIKSYLQLLKIILIFFAVIVIVALLTNKNPMSLILGMSAMAAVLMLVFQDTILGLVASIQVSVNDMLKPGDWIEMPARKADGIVQEINLTTVKVQNWDLTITTIPTFALVKESFINWKGMEQGYGRRIAVSLLLDPRTIAPCTSTQLTAFSELLQRGDTPFEITQGGATMHLLPNDRQLCSDQATTPSNLRLFRLYALAYLKRNPNVVQSADILVRALNPTPAGVPLQFYCFSIDRGYMGCGAIQSAILEHLYSMLPIFGLKPAIPIPDPSQS